MVWFHTFMSPYCAIMCWVTVIISMTILASPTHLWGETTGDRWFPQNSVMWSFCVCFAVGLNNLLDKQSSCPWLKTPWRKCYFTVLTARHFKNVVRPQMLIALQRKLHWLSWISILSFKDGKLLMITLSCAMPADNQSTESTRPSTCLMSTM